MLFPMVLDTSSSPTIYLVIKSYICVYFYRYVGVILVNGKSSFFHPGTLPRRARLHCELQVMIMCSFTVNPPSKNDGCKRAFGGGAPEGFCAGGTCE